MWREQEEFPLTGQRARLSDTRCRQTTVVLHDQLHVVSHAIAPCKVQLYPRQPLENKQDLVGSTLRIFYARLN